MILLPILFINLVILVDSYRNPNEIPSFFSWKPFIVLTGSMNQEIASGDLAVVKDVDPNTLKKEEQIEGIYKFKIKRLGDLAMFLQTTKGIVLCLSIPIALLILLQIIQSINNRREMRQKDKNEKELEEEIKRLKKENNEFAKSKKEE